MNMNTYIKYTETNIKKDLTTINTWNMTKCAWCEAGLTLSFASPVKFTGNNRVKCIISSFQNHKYCNHKLNNARTVVTSNTSCLVRAVSTKEGLHSFPIIMEMSHQRAHTNIWHKCYNKPCKLQCHSSIFFISSTIIECNLPIPLPKYEARREGREMFS
jgi:hypothetical protein